MIKRSIPWYNQPQYRVKIAAEYISYVSTARVWNLPPTLGIDARFDNISAFAKTGTIAVATSSGGVGVKGDGSTGLYSRTSSVVPQPMWMMAQFTVSAVGATQKTVYSIGSAGVTSGAICAISHGDNVSASNILVQLRAIDVTGPAIGKLGPIPTVGVTYTVVAVYPSALKADAYIYVNGVKYTTDSASSTNVVFAGASTLVNESVGALKRGTTALYTNDTILFTARGTGQIPESLAKRISENPYSLLQPQQRNIYVSVAGGGLNVTGLLGTADATGLTANVDKQLAITATLATATAAGLTAQVDTQAAITATLATSTADGLTANVDKQFAISGTLATATADGIIAGVDTQLAIAGSLATATAGGIAATIDQQLAIAATLATATADGTTATIDRQLTIVGALATATADGIQATISNGLTINATLATATAAGFNANIDNQIAISGSLATAIADGISASISFGNDLNISASLGTATASGLTAGVDSQTAVTATLGQATADGFSASVTLASSWTGEPFNFASPITRTFDFTSSITKTLNFESPI